jgi:hypothetical protein
MAVARPIRFLFLAVFCIIIYIVYTITGSEKPVQTIRPVGGDLGKEFRVDKDFVEPNLESMASV